MTVGRITFGRPSKAQERMDFEAVPDLVRRLQQDNERLRRQVRALIEHCARVHACDVTKEKGLLEE